MQKSPFVWLGSRRAKRRGVGDVGRLLDEVASSGLPVPAGAILLDELYQVLLAEKVLTMTDDRLMVPEPALLYDTLYRAVRFPKLDGPVIVKGVFSSSGEGNPQIGSHFPPQQPVDFNDPVQLADSLSTVWSSASRWERDHQPTSGSLRRDILVMKTVNATLSGTAQCQQESEHDLARYQENSGEMTLPLPKLRFLEQPHQQLPSFGRRLQRLLRGIRRTLGRRDWQIQWADDGRICWLIHVLPQ